LLDAGATGRCGCRFRHEVPENRLACLEAPRRRLRGLLYFRLFAD
jgi:hypothetical protein